VTTRSFLGRPLRRVAAVLFLVTVALFAVGVALEKDGHAEPAAAVTEAPDHAEGGEEGGHDEDTVTEEVGHDDGGESESVLGVDLESPLTVTLAVVGSLLLAIGLWFTDRRGVAAAAVAGGLAFAVFDVAEVAHQVDASRSGLAVLAVVLVLCHTAAAGAAALNVIST